MSLGFTSPRCLHRHKRAAEQVSETSRSWDPASREGELGFWKMLRTTAPVHHDKSSSIQVGCRHVPPSVATHLRQYRPQQHCSCISHGYFIYMHLASGFFLRSPITLPLSSINNLPHQIICLFDNLSTCTWWSIVKASLEACFFNRDHGLVRILWHLSLRSVF